MDVQDGVPGIHNIVRLGRQLAAGDVSNLKGHLQSQNIPCLRCLTFSPYQYTALAVALCPQ